MQQTQGKPHIRPVVHHRDDRQAHGRGDMTAMLRNVEAMEQASLRVIAKLDQMAASVA